MKIQPTGDYVVYHIDPVTVFADLDEVETMKKLLNEVAYQYTRILSKPQKLCLADIVIQKTIDKIGEL